MDDQSSLDRFRTWMRTSVTVRLLSIGILVLLMLIPISFVESLISERQSTKDNAVAEISQKWGNSQTLAGPYISVPFRSEDQVYNDAKGKYETFYSDKYATLLPENLIITSDVKTEKRRRGIYDAVVYKTVVNVSGSFDFSELKKLRVKNFDFKKSDITQGMSDLRSIKNVSLKFGDKTINFDPGIKSQDISSAGISAPLALDSTCYKNKVEFSYTLDFKGSQTLYFIPLGKQTSVTMTADNPNPKFDGAFLPEHKITKDGFTATWEVFHLNRNYPQAFVDFQSGIPESAFGASLLIGVDEYQKNTRAAKYAVLIIILTFMTYFFMQTRNGIDIHFIQYLLVGFALAVFYVLLVSLSEHISFTSAYWIGSFATIALITAYSHTMLKKLKLTAITSFILLILYLFIFVIIQLQSYALLVGSIGLFIVVAAAMFASRNIDWYSLTNKNKE